MHANKFVVFLWRTRAHVRCYMDIGFLSEDDYCFRNRFWVPPAKCHLASNTQFDESVHLSRTIRRLQNHASYVYAWNNARMYTLFECVCLLMRADCSQLFIVYHLLTVDLANGKMEYTLGRCGSAAYWHTIANVWTIVNFGINLFRAERVYRV